MYCILTSVYSFSVPVCINITFKWLFISHGNRGQGNSCLLLWQHCLVRHTYRN